MADAIVASYRERPPSDDESEWAVANARRMVEVSDRNTARTIRPRKGPGTQAARYEINS